METWLVAPGEVDDPWNKAKNAGYKGWVKGGDVLFFPHVESCCALILFGENFIVGGHMSASLPAPHYDPDSESPKNGRYVADQVTADYRRLNTRSPLLMAIGPENWYTQEVPRIVRTINPSGTRRLRFSWDFPQGVDVWVNGEKVVIQRHVDQIHGPVHVGKQIQFSPPEVDLYPPIEDIS